MPNSLVHLPNGQTLTVSPVFGGLFFKSNELSHSNSPFPPGWTIVLNSEDDDDHDAKEQETPEGPSSTTATTSLTRPASSDKSQIPRRHIHRFTRPTLDKDQLYISSISQPSSSDFKPPTSPSRQIAMMLWATLYWYFHQPEPDPQMINEHSEKTVEAGRPKGEWRISINRQGIFKSKILLPKLERMGLIATEESSVGADLNEGSEDGWTKLFVSKRSFWQLDPRIYLFTLSPIPQSPFSTGSPFTSRPSSPAMVDTPSQKESQTEALVSQGLWSPTAPGPFHSSSHLPTYYPPPPTQYIFTNNVRHPVRPKPPRQGEILYTRFIPSLGQYLSFRIASLSPQPLRHRGPTSPSPVPSTDLTDAEYLHKWMNDPRIAHFWGQTGDLASQQAFLAAGLRSRHAFPLIGCWDGRPFGYFEVYWVKEDKLGRSMPHVGDYDRGVHLLIGEAAFRGPKRVKAWLSALVHYCLLADLRTETVVLEPRVDNVKLKSYLEDEGFYREREVSFAHKQSNLMKLHRDAWEGPAL